MFFYVSGMVATYFDTEKKNFNTFAKNKAFKLLVPFLAAIFIYLFPRLYLGQSFEDFTRPND